MSILTKSSGYFGCLLATFALTLGPAASQAEGPAPKKAQAKFEVRWMQNMIDHHHMAVMMGNCAPIGQCIRS